MIVRFGLRDVAALAWSKVAAAAGELREVWRELAADDCARRRSHVCRCGARWVDRDVARPGTWS